MRKIFFFFNTIENLRRVVFFFRQEKLLGELSEKDSHIADLEMDRNSTGASTRAMTIEKLNNEKQQLYNQLKELVRKFLLEETKKQKGKTFCCCFFFVHF